MKRLFWAAAFLLGCSPVRADIIFTVGNHPQPDEMNVLLNSGDSGTTITGTITGFSVLFSSTQTLLAPSSGQARISADPEGSPLTNLSIALDGAVYGDIILNPFIGSCTGCVVGGNASVTVNAVDSNGLPEGQLTFTYALGNGQNFLTIVASNGEAIVSTTIDAPGGFHDLRQPRISAPEAVTSPVPEPATITMMGLGAIGLGLIRKRHKVS